MFADLARNLHGHFRWDGGIADASAMQNAIMNNYDAGIYEHTAKTWAFSIMNCGSIKRPKEKNRSITGKQMIERIEKQYCKIDDARAELDEIGSDMQMNAGPALDPETATDESELDLYEMAYDLSSQAEQLADAIQDYLKLVKRGDQMKTETIQHDAIQAVVFKLRMNEVLRDRLNAPGATWNDFIWGNAYLDMRMIDQDSKKDLSAALYTLKNCGFYPIDSIWDLTQVTQERDFMTYGDHLNYLFHSDNLDRHRDPAIWRKKYSASLSVGDVVAFTGFYRETDEPVVYLVANIGFIQLSKPQRRYLRITFDHMPGLNGNATKRPYKPHNSATR